MENIVLVGSGGCMRELLWQIEEANKRLPRYTVLGYVDLVEDLAMDAVGHCKYLGDDEYLVNLPMKTGVVLCIGSPNKRQQLVSMYKKNPNLYFPKIILSDEGMAPDYTMGEGSIISRDCTISTNVTIGNFVFINIGSIVCHDCVIGDYSTLAPRVTLCGNVEVGNSTYVGASATVKQGINIGSDVMVGAGAVVVDDIDNDLTVVGVPAREMEQKAY
ncbi:MAG: NeuD/PglB/VioB family sugar acetyltransferase [Lachnospiraceae bacterium]|nr:NeuD/PglB/VioB family sugar acetyltransferase [Lachnospiraceae bacterium]